MPKQTFFNLPDDKRQHVLDCAVDEFAQRGYKLASISRIVAAAGIAKGSFYQYFDDKDDLYIHIITTLIADRKLANYEREKRRLEDLNLTEFLRVVFRTQMQDFRSQPKLMKVALEMMQLTNEPIFQRIMGQYQNQANTYFLPFIQHEVEQGELDPKVNGQLLNFMLVSLGQYLIHRYNSAQFEGISEALIDEVVDDLDYILRNGIYGSNNQV